MTLPQKVITSLFVVLWVYQPFFVVEFKEIVEEVQRGASAILKWAANRGSKAVVFGGHSAGAHLAAMLMHDNEYCEREENFNLVKGFVHISGVFDLVPLVHTSMNDPLKLGRETAQHFSPQYLFTTLVTEKIKKIKQVVVVGEHDPPEFRRQSADYAHVSQTVNQCSLTLISCFCHHRVSLDLGSKMSISDFLTALTTLTLWKSSRKKTMYSQR